MLPVCASLDGEYGLRNICIGVPARLGAAGIERIMELPLSQEERAALVAAAAQVRQGISALAALQANPR